MYNCWITINKEPTIINSCGVRIFGNHIYQNPSGNNKRGYCKEHHTLFRVETGTYHIFAASRDREDITKEDQYRLASTAAVKIEQPENYIIKYRITSGLRHERHISDLEYMKEGVLSVIDNQIITNDTCSDHIGPINKLTFTKRRDQRIAAEREAFEKRIKEKEEAWKKELRELEIKKLDESFIEETVETSFSDIWSINTVESVSWIKRIRSWLCCKTPVTPTTNESLSDSLTAEEQSINYHRCYLEYLEESSSKELSSNLNWKINDIRHYIKFSDWEYGDKESKYSFWNEELNLLISKVCEVYFSPETNEEIGTDYIQNVINWLRITRSQIPEEFLIHKPEEEEEILNGSSEEPIWLIVADLVNCRVQGFNDYEDSLESIHSDDETSPQVWTVESDPSSDFTTRDSKLRLILNRIFKLFD